jgi:uncharacterized protein (TIGR02099 family)
MPPVRATSRAPAVVPRALLRLTRVLALAAAAGFVAFALLLLALRFLVIPNVDRYRDDLAAAIAAQLGQPVELGPLTAGWDGWNPKLVVQDVRVLDRQRAAATPLLELPEVDLTVAWTSLPLLQLRLKELVIERPRLAIRRDRAGVVHVAGLEFDPAQAADDSPLMDWLLHQRQIVVRDALITWNDDLRNAPQLVLDRVQFRVESRLGRHRFGLRGTPPTELAAPIDVRGELSGSSIADWQSAEGRLYVRLDYADVAAWQEWLPLPMAMTRGKGALRIWFDFARGDAREIVADLELADVAVRLGKGLPELDLAHLSGRLGWRADAARRELFGRELAFATAAGQRFEPATFTLTLREARAGNAATGLAEVDHLQLEPLRDLAAHLPLPAAWRDDLARFAPRGSISRGRLLWEGPLEAPTAFTISGEFAGLGVAAQGAMPGATGLTGGVEATHAGGTLKLASREAMLDMPRLFAAPIALDALTGSIGWERKDGRTRIRVERLEFANPQLAGTVAGTYRTAPNGPGEIDLTAQIARADVRDVHRYLPVDLREGTRTWLRDALIAGTLTDARLRLVGDLAAFPFPGGKGGQFLVTAKGRGITLGYASDWPPLSELDADLRFEGSGLVVDASRGRVFEAQLGRTRAAIADMGLASPVLKVAGSAAGPTAEFLRFIERSPVAGMIDRFTDGAQATGNGRLDLKLELPLGAPAGNRVAGEFTFAGNRLQLPGVPPLAQVNGKLAFTEHDIQARDIALEVFGGPAKVAIASVAGGPRLTGTGSANLGTLRRDFPGLLAERVSGSVEWTLTADLRPGFVSWAVESPLKGAVVDLPPPLGKSSAETVALRVERRASPGEAGADVIAVSYGQQAQLVLHRKPADEGARIDRALLLMGRAVDRAGPPTAERPGVWVRAELPVLHADDWLALQRAAGAGKGGGELDVEGVDLDAGTLDVLGRRFTDLKVAARRARGEWKLDLRGGEVTGTASWSPPTVDAPNGRLAARLTRLAMLPPSAPAGAATAPGRTGTGAPNPWPEIDFAAESYVVHGRDIGRLELEAHPQGGDWRIDKLRITNETGSIAADGWTRVAGGREQTKLDIQLEAKEAGPFLARLGYPDALVGAPTTIKGQLAWSGAPNEFEFPSLSGSFRIDVGPGRFTKLDPGIGKLLGVLSLQALPRRITLDFRDVFSEGFAFDEIAGSVRIHNGVMTSDGLNLAGAAAQVALAGDVDLAHETQRLTVRVQPTLSAGVSAGAALLFLANPLVGAAVGAGSLLAQKVLKDPIEQMFSYEYLVTGSWADPLVTRSGSATTSVAPQSPAEPTTR